ncbi:hypothetical protein DJ021_02525 [Phenylobacterium hankyongense]|uniref:Uncharacterized protein n=1 Tax=Phenylobacterium hankyongense TaxID=1813876 RepID=A0A328AWY1_9CAUL|nr:hypothetical protein [Phenylobacterium hankyongense]RAK58755.1 hypothetical protein DJ021_02525 [Phenylobacterium hankyongense]
MASYRIYYVGAGGRLRLDRDMDCAGDREAVEKLLDRRADGRAGELWNGGRLVGRFSKLGLFTPAVGS